MDFFNTFLHWQPSLYCHGQAVTMYWTHCGRAFSCL